MVSSLTNPVHFITFSSPSSFSPFGHHENGPLRSPAEGTRIHSWFQTVPPWRHHHLWLRIFLHDPFIQWLSTTGVLIWAHTCEKGAHLMGNFGLRTCHQPGQNFLRMRCRLRLFVHNPSSSSPSLLWPTPWSEVSPYFLLFSALSFIGICSNPDLGSTSQQIQLNIFLFILIFFSLSHLPFSSPSLPLVLPLSSFGFFAMFTPTWLSVEFCSRDIGNQTVYGIEHGWMTEQSWQFYLF